MSKAHLSLDKALLAESYVVNISARVCLLQTAARLHRVRL
jgi:hypothetical protein